MAATRASTPAATPESRGQDGPARASVRPRSQIGWIVAVLRSRTRRRTHVEDLMPEVPRDGVGVHRGAVLRGEVM